MRTQDNATGGQDTAAKQQTAFWNQLGDPMANVPLAQPLDGATRHRHNLSKAQIFGLDQSTLAAQRHLDRARGTYSATPTSPRRRRR